MHQKSWLWPLKTSLLVANLQIKSSWQDFHPCNPISYRVRSICSTSLSWNLICLNLVFSCSIGIKHHALKTLHQQHLLAIPSFEFCGGIALKRAPPTSLPSFFPAQSCPNLPMSEDNSGRIWISQGLRCGAARKTISYSCQTQEGASFYIKGGNLRDRSSKELITVSSNSIIQINIRPSANFLGGYLWMLINNTSIKEIIFSLFSTSKGVYRSKLHQDLVNRT